MAESVVTTTVNKSWGDSAYHVLASLAINGTPGTYATGGIAMNLNQSNIKASRTPLNVSVRGNAGYIYSYVKGTDNSNGLLMIFAQTASASEDDPLGQLAAATMPAAVAADIITAEITYRGME